MILCTSSNIDKGYCGAFVIQIHYRFEDTTGLRLGRSLVRSAVRELSTKENTLQLRNKNFLPWYDKGMFTHSI